jgi:hypothetical protein
MAALPPAIARSLDAIGRLARELENELVTLREMSAAYARDAFVNPGGIKDEAPTIWRNVAAQHVRCRPVLRNLLRS